MSLVYPFEKEMQPDGSSVDTIDCYAGCQLQCPYCFQYSDCNWSKDILVRKNLPDLLRKNLDDHSARELYIGSLSDPYMPLEEKYKLTRQCLSILSNSNYHVYITTKADQNLLLRDVDVLKSFRNPPRILLGLSSINEADKGANHINIKLANALKGLGIDVWAFITPILPYVMDLDGMISSIHPDIPIHLDKLRVMTKGSQDKKVFNWIQNNFPQYESNYRKILFENDESYYHQIVEKYTKSKNIRFMFELWGE